MQTTTTNNSYPKRYMTIKELLPFGFSEWELKKYTKIRGFPAHKAGATAPWKIDTSKLDNWLTRRFGA